MISEKAKKAIDALSEQELRFEMELGSQSRFQREKFSYLKVRLAELENTPKEAAQDNSNMKIFVSWSGHASHQVAVALRDWLPVVLPYVEPWVSSLDINKGARWAGEIAVQLSASNYGIICIVPGNVDEPWLNFEAGAISKTLEIARVAPLLVGVDRSEVNGGPLAQFQNTVFDMKDLRQLVLSINAAHETPLDNGKVVRAFETCWQSIENTIAEIDFDEQDEEEDEDDENDIEQEEDELEEIDENILVFLSENEGYSLPVSNIAQAVNASLTKTTHHLRLLAENEYVYDTLAMDNEDEYGLHHNGRAYLLEHEIIE